MILLPEPVNRIDIAIDNWWEVLRGYPAIDRLIYAASEAADFSLIWHACGLIRAITEDDPKIAIKLSAALGIESALVNGPVKAIFQRARPLQEVPRPHKLRRPKTSSFPSGHASAATVAAVLLADGKERKAWYALAAIVATSRIHVRIHHASDVLGGVIAGGVLGLVARKIFDFD